MPSNNRQRRRQRRENERRRIRRRTQARLAAAAHRIGRDTRPRTSRSTIGRTHRADPRLANGVRRGELGGSFAVRRALEDLRSSRDSRPRRQVGQARPTQMPLMVYDDDDDYQFDPYEGPDHGDPFLNSDEESQSAEEISEPPSAPVVRQGRRSRTRTNATQTYVISCSLDSEAKLTVMQRPGLLTVIGILVRS